MLGSWGGVLHIPGSKAHRPRFRSQLCLLKAVSPPACNLTSLCHGLLFKTIVITPFSQGAEGSHHRALSKR